jgi:hypothetical protein
VIGEKSKIKYRSQAVLTESRQKRRADSKGKQAAEESRQQGEKVADASRGEQAADKSG